MWFRGGGSGGGRGGGWCGGDSADGLDGEENVKRASGMLQMVVGV